MCHVLALLVCVFLPFGMFIIQHTHNDTIIWQDTMVSMIAFQLCALSFVALLRLTFSPLHLFANKTPPKKRAGNGMTDLNWPSPSTWISRKSPELISLSFNLTRTGTFGERTSGRMWVMACAFRAAFFVVRNICFTKLYTATPPFRWCDRRMSSRCSPLSMFLDRTPL